MTDTGRASALIVGGLIVLMWWLVPGADVAEEQRERVLNKSENVSLMASGEMILPDKMRECEADSECEITLDNCGRCGETAINSQYVKTYEAQYAALCDIWEGDECNYQAGKNTGMCEAGICVLVSE